MTATDVTHLEIRAALKGAAFPADGDDLASVARVNQADPDIVELFERLPASDVYESVEEVLDELNLDHTAIDDTRELRMALGLGDDEAPPGFDDPADGIEEPDELDGFTVADDHGLEDDLAAEDDWGDDELDDDLDLADGDLDDDTL